MATTFDHEYWVRDILGLEALALLEAVGGDATVGDTTAVGEYASATAASLSQMQTEARAFWLAGEPNAAGVVSTGIAPATLAYRYVAFRSDNAQVAAWTTGNGSPEVTVEYAVGLRSLAAWEGSATAQVQALFQFIATLAQDPATLTPAGTSDAATAAALTGIFDGKMCPPRTLVASTARNGTTSIGYDWSCCGLLASLTAAAYPASLIAAKAATVKPARRYREGSQRDEIFDDLARLASSGLSSQTQQIAKTWYTHSAARVGQMFRQGQTIFELKGA